MRSLGQNVFNYDQYIYEMVIIKHSWLNKRIWLYGYTKLHGKYTKNYPLACLMGLSHPVDLECTLV